MDLANDALAELDLVIGSVHSHMNQGVRRDDRPAAGRASGPVDYAAAALELGLAISFSGLVFRRGEESSAVVAGFVPTERLLMETDSPALVFLGVPRHSAPPPAPGAPPTFSWPAQLAGMGSRHRRVARGATDTSPHTIGDGTKETSFL